MIEKIIEYSARNRFMVFLFVGFATVLGLWSMKTVPLDAIPDLTDVQVIVFTEWMGRSPQLVEDQITYPIVTSMLAAPKVKTVRGYSMFGMSFVYIIFDDGTDIYWARSRVMEYMSKITGNLPEAVTPYIGPDATGVGWVYQYALVDKSGKNDLAQIRTFQDWYLKYWLESIQGVSEVAAVGGFKRQYQIELDPNKLVAYNLPLGQIMQAVKASNNDVGGRVVELAGREYVVRGKGYINSLKDVENIVVDTDMLGTPVLMRDVANVHFGPDIRRGAADFNGEGEVVGGIVVMRFGENALDVINRVKEKVKEILPSLPEGVEFVPVYDRSELIKRSIKTLINTLLEESIIVSIVIFVFLLHFRSAFIAIITLPIAVILAFIPMKQMGLTSNIMSLGGIAIAIGAMVDAAIILVENTHKHLERDEGNKPRFDILVDAAKEVGRPIFFALLVITVSFIPVFTLEAQEGRLFKPLAYTKTFSMFFAAILAITLAPALMPLLIRGKIHHEARHPVSRVLSFIYEPALNLVLRFKKTIIIIALVVMASTLWAFSQIGSEFMPPLREGSILFMPTTLPGVSIEQAKQSMQMQDRIIKSFSEVKTVFGKVGRADSPTDPAPLDMLETTIVLKPESEWREGMTYEKLIDEMDKAVKLPGLTNAWTMPIKGRIDMLTTGIKTPIGIKIFGDDLEEIQRIGSHLEAILRPVPGTRSVFAERTTGGYYLDITPKREEAARYGLNVEDVLHVIEIAIGGMNIDTTVEGRERYTINLRYPRELREDMEKLMRVLVPTKTGAQVPLTQIADINFSLGPPMLKDEDGALTGWVYVDVVGRDIGSYVKEAKATVQEKLKLKSGYYLKWTGQYEFMLRVKKKLMLVIPLTLAIVIMLLYFNCKSWVETGVILLAVPFSLVGAIWLIWYLDYNMSIAVWVGIIALAGLDAETGVVMLLYLKLAYDDRNEKGLMKSAKDLHEAVHDGAVKRVRPKIMTVSAILLGLVPIMWSHGTGSDVMKRIAAPMVGGVVTSMILELLIYPVLFTFWKGFEVKKLAAKAAGGNTIVKEGDDPK